MAYQIFPANRARELASLDPEPGDPAYATRVGYKFGIFW